MRLVLMAVLSSFFLLGSTAMAGECVDAQGKDIFNEPEIFQALIAKKETCYEAKSLAESCAYGSSLDVSTAGEAIKVCSANLKAAKPSTSLKSLLATMQKACNKKYEKMEGTMFRSANSFCNLEAVEFINNLAQDNG